MTKKRLIVYILTVTLSLAYIFFGSKIAFSSISETLQSHAITLFSGKVTEITSVVDTKNPYLEKAPSSKRIEFLVEMNYIGKKQTVPAVQIIDGMMTHGMTAVEVGNKVLLFETLDPTEAIKFTFSDYYRSDYLLFLLGAFFALLIIFGGLKGLNTILSLSFTCGAIFLVFVPSVLGGFNIYLSAIVTCLFIIIMTLLIINGADLKSFISILGCFGGVLIAGILTALLQSSMKLTGYVDEHAIFLKDLPLGFDISLHAVVFAAIIIGAMGAIMDVSISISSALHELSQTSQSPTFKSLLKSGNAIGRDIMGTMANTLILAYIGSSLSVVLLMFAYNSSLTMVFNREMIVIEVLQSLVGSIGILFAIPITSLLGSLLYSKR